MLQFRLTKHAIERMTERRISHDDISLVLSHGVTTITAIGRKITRLGWFSLDLDPTLREFADIRVVWNDKNILTVFRA
ncbi:MAG: DUF4258 domain-containing protein [Candidatus Melainabacteria bacterium]|nr:DUF4258 domain-containing protein [Candidatus Melainabacteria bacterium]